MKKKCNCAYGNCHLCREDSSWSKTKMVKSTKRDAYEVYNIKRAAEVVKRYCVDEKCGIRGYECTQCRILSDVILAERRKAYEECARIAEEAVKTYASSYRGVGLEIADEIRRRIKDEPTN